jgi:formamidopyrimidine-DNA glycosylase
MTGQLLFFPPHRGGKKSDDGSPTHPGVVLSLGAGGRLVYADVRRFGCLRRYKVDEWEAEDARLGPEPFDPGLTPVALHSQLGTSRSPVRSWLLDQTRIAGIGNIYAIEALFRAGVHPKRAANSIAPEESDRILTAIREVLSASIQAQGTTLRDFRTASGEEGGFRSFLQAYGREGDPCKRCNTPIERIVFGNRSAFFCSSCQPGP